MFFWSFQVHCLRYHFAGFPHWRSWMCNPAVTDRSKPEETEVLWSVLHSQLIFSDISSVWSLLLPLFPGVVLTGCNRYFFNVLCDLVQKSSQKAKVFFAETIEKYFLVILHLLHATFFGLLAFFCHIDSWDTLIFFIGFSVKESRFFQALDSYVDSRWFDVQFFCDLALAQSVFVCQ